MGRAGPVTQREVCRLRLEGTDHAGPQPPGKDQTLPLSASAALSPHHLPQHRAPPPHRSRAGTGKWMDLEPEITGFKSQHCHFLATWT